MQIIQCKQGSDEWHKARLGMITASRVFDILPGKSGYKAARSKYMSELICEILTGKIQDSFCSWSIQHGKEVEAVSRSAYEVKTGRLINEVGFIISDLTGFLGCSPDGFVDNRKGVEIKCPTTQVHIETIIKRDKGLKKTHPNYYTQIQTGMFCTDFQEWDYVSYDNRLPANLQIYIETIKRDNEYIKIIANEIKQFKDELACQLDRLRSFIGNGEVS